MKRFLIVTILLAVALTTPAMAAEKMLYVDGNGVLMVTPDIAYIDIGVKTIGETEDAASAENTAKTKALIEQLTSVGVESKDIKSRRYYVEPIFNYWEESGEYEEAISSYEVENSFTVKVRNIENIGKIMNAAIEGGSNIMRGLNYGVEDKSAYYGQLYANAINDADKKAQAIAKSMGITLSEPVSISEDSYYSYGDPYYSNYYMDSVSITSIDAGTYVFPGEIELLVTLHVTFEY